jgi:adenylate cyclase
MTEDVIAALSRFKTFAVVARGSSFADATRGATAAEAATALGVRYVLEGSVRRDGPRLRVTAQLTDAAGVVLWSDRFEEELGGVFDVQDRITAAVVSLVEPRITRTEIERSRRKHPENLDAYDHFLRGMAQLHQLDPSRASVDALVHHLDRAAALDPSFPQALACAGWAHELRRTYGVATADGPRTSPQPSTYATGPRRRPGTMRSFWSVAGWSGTTSRRRRASPAARALALNPHSYLVYTSAPRSHASAPPAHTAIGLFERSLRLSPNSPTMHGPSTRSPPATSMPAAFPSRRVGEAVAGHARRLGPAARHVAVAHAMLDQLDEARSALDRFLALRRHDHPRPPASAAAGHAPQRRAHLARRPAPRGTAGGLRHALGARPI